MWTVRTALDVLSALSNAGISLASRKAEFSAHTKGLKPGVDDPVAAIEGNAEKLTVDLWNPLRLRPWRKKLYTWRQETPHSLFGRIRPSSGIIFDTDWRTHAAARCADNFGSANR